MVLKHGVEGDEEFSGDGDIDQFAGFAGGEQTIVEGGDAGVTASCVSSGDERSAAHAESARARGARGTGTLIDL